jgi:predicted HAD superfamily Cof-like phosphohydrolase
MTNDSVLANFGCVGEFHRVFEHPIKYSPDIQVFDENPKLVSLRYSLIEEEAKEFIEAVNNKDIVEMLDALADIDYVVYGAGLSFGINMDSMLTLARLPETRSGSPTEFFIRATEADLDKMCESLRKLLKDLKLAIDGRNMIEVAIVLLKIIEQTYTAAAEMGVNLDDAFRLVHESNMTKACKDEQQASESLSQYLADISVYKDPAVRQSKDGKYWIVYDRATGKTLKSKFYKPVDLKSLVV